MTDIVTTPPGESIDSYVLTFMSQTMPFSNWSAHRIHIWGRTFATVEHAYQYKKFCDVDARYAESIKAARSAWKAKQLARSKQLNTKTWDTQREQVMTELIEAKVAQHEDVRRALLDTGSKAIIQQGDPMDLFWCVGWNGRGENKLGTIWMAVRTKLEVKSTAQTLR